MFAIDKILPLSVQEYSPDSNLSYLLGVWLFFCLPICISAIITIFIIQFYYRSNNKEIEMYRKWKSDLEIRSF